MDLKFDKSKEENKEKQEVKKTSEAPGIERPKHSSRIIAGSKPGETIHITENDQGKTETLTVKEGQTLEQVKKENDQKKKEREDRLKAEAQGKK
jgi:hypothetical protein